MRTLYCNGRFFPQWQSSLKQVYVTGCQSLIVIVIAGFFIGMVLGLQGYMILNRFGAEDALGQLVALALLRELSPVLAALLFAGRAGSTMSAELGLMRATEQLSSMAIMGVNPIYKVVAPRFYAGIITLPLLTVIFSVVAAFGAWLFGVKLFEIDSGAFWGNMQQAVDFRLDLLNSCIKSFFFAIVITWIAVYEGFYCSQTSEGIGQATTRTVVLSSLAILGMDFLLTAVMFGGAQL